MPYFPSWKQATMNHTHAPICVMVGMYTNILRKCTLLELIRTDCDNSSSSICQSCSEHVHNEIYAINMQPTLHHFRILFNLYKAM